MFNGGGIGRLERAFLSRRAGRAMAHTAASTRARYRAAGLRRGAGSAGAGDGARGRGLPAGCGRGTLGYGLWRAALLLSDWL